MQAFRFELDPRDRTRSSRPCCRTPHAPMAAPPRTTLIVHQRSQVLFTDQRNNARRSSARPAYASHAAAFRARRAARRSSIPAALIRATSATPRPAASRRE